MTYNDFEAAPGGDASVALVDSSSVGEIGNTVSEALLIAIG